jgi:hypothetical protein
MKTVAIFVLLAFVLLPVAISFFSVIAKSLAKRNEASSESSLAIILKLGTTKPRRKFLYLVVSFYGVCFLAAVLFFILQVIAPAFNLPQKVIMFFVIFMLIFTGALSVGVFSLCRYILSVNPVTEEGLTEKSRLEWENRSADIYSKIIGRWLFYSVGFTLLALTVFMLAVYCLG